MRNLRVDCGKNVNFDAGIVGHCIDADNGFLYALSSKFELFQLRIYDQTSQPSKIETQLDVQSIEANNIEPDDIRLIDYVVEGGSVLIAHKNGRLIRIGVTSFAPPSEIIYTHNKQISSGGLSPDQDYIALADEADNLFILSIDGIIMYEQSASTYDNSLHKPVGVGWGSKETQFFGLDGRLAKEQQPKETLVLNDQELANVEKIESSLPFTQIRQKQVRSTQVDWRGDGKYLATLTFLPDSNKHILKVWNRNLDLQYMSEQLFDVERSLLSWVPNGNFICCAQRREQGVSDIAMFEKNGMVHQRIALPLVMRNIYIKDISWSPDSKVLALIVNQFIATDDNDQVSFRPVLMLYTMQNFHYYLKFSTNLAQGCTYSLKWDSIHESRLHTVSSNGQYREFVCSLQVTFSEDCSTVAVIDANKILLTPMDLCTIPPPMCAIVIEIDNPIYRMSIDATTAHNIFLLTLDNKLVCFGSSSECASGDTKIKVSLKNNVAKRVHDNLGNPRIFAIDDAQSYQHLTVVNSSCLAAVRSVGNNSELIMISLPNIESKEDKLTQKKLTTFENRQVVEISRYYGSESKQLTLLLDDGSCLLADPSSGSIKMLFEYDPMLARQGLNYINSQSLMTADGETIQLSLAQDYGLRFDSDTLLVNHCTSFRLTDHYMVYTTADHLLHFMLIEQLVAKKLNINHEVESWSQQIEMHGVLIVVSESTSKVILQMPRGNLEILHPRVLVFKHLTRLLDQFEYVAAIKLARRHRINMNFLCDYLLCYSKWEEKIQDFAHFIAKFDPSLLNLFITELEEDSSLDNRYKNIIDHLPQTRVNLKDLRCASNYWSATPDYVGSNKVSTVCQCIHLPDETKFLQPRLLRLLKMKMKRSVSEALQIVYELPEADQDDALKFMLYFTDVDHLFVEGLRTFSTRIALMVASSSNKDPKEYLALLKEFDGIEKEKMRNFKISMHIKEYEQALDFLIDYSKEADDTEAIWLEIIDLIVSKRLYKHAIVTISGREGGKSIRLEKIWSKYADYLLEKRYFGESGFAYSRAYYIAENEVHLKSALKAWSLSHDWPESIVLIKKSKIDCSVKQDYLSKISKQLIERGDYCSALLISTPPRDQEEQLLTELTARNHWWFADYFSGASSRQVILSTIKTSLLDFSSSFDHNWKTKIDDSEYYYGRLKELINSYQAKKLEPCNQLPLAATMDYQAPDCLSTIDGSEVSSVSDMDEQKVARSGALSIKTKNSTKSNKSQASTRQKRIKITEGSKYEDLAIIIELKKFVDELQVTRRSLMIFISTAFEYLPLLEAKKITDSVKDLYSKAVTFATEFCESLWPTEPQTEDKYSLYRRFSDIFKMNEPLENVDFEVLIRPQVPKELNYFELI